MQFEIGKRKAKSWNIKLGQHDDLKTQLKNYKIPNVET